MIIRMIGRYEGGDDDIDKIYDINEDDYGDWIGMEDGLEGMD
jgi:hypothetical protein